MCSLFGIIDHAGVLSAKNKNRILSVLSNECEIRGTDATGIAYNYAGMLMVYKRPLPAHKLRFHVPNGVRVVMGHTRMTTQGSPKFNANNHPFTGRGFALAHNGVLFNDQLLRETHQLPRTKIRTDSYVAVQLLNREKTLNFSALKSMAEAVEGSFVFTVLDRADNLYFVRGDNPLAIFCYDGFMLYASTAEILTLTEKRLGLHHRDMIQTHEGDILKIDRNGKAQFGGFVLRESWHWWDYAAGDCLPTHCEDVEILMEAAKSFGVTEKEVDILLDYGFDADEIADLLYQPSLLRELIDELQCAY